ncbi:MAG: metallophosphatase family protein [Gammaproteobacteria bacterium]|nr:metallophosphatase family protein [Gammaproteobacteria bacterium]
MIKIFHTGDLHFCQKHLEQVDRCMTYAVEQAIADGAEVAVIAGDSFDSAMHVHEPAFARYLELMLQLADAMPLLILQGTFSHDRLGSLEPLKRLRARYPILVADEPGQWILHEDGVMTWDRVGADTVPLRTDRAVFSCLPSLNKASTEIREHAHGAAGYVADLLSSWGQTNDQARAAGIPTVLVSHGTVSGCVTESNYAMVSPDHEFSVGTLYQAQAQATMLNHIHKHQSWQDNGRLIAYSGSVARLVHGHHDPVGFLLWEVDANSAAFKFHPTPARELIDITFDGPPDIDELRRLAGQYTSDMHHVRIRYEIDQDHAHTIDKDAIREMFTAAGDVRIEATVYPVQSIRASGIGRAMTLHEKLGYWAATTGDEHRLDGLESRLEMLQTMEPEQIIDHLLGRDEEEKREAA